MITYDVPVEFWSDWNPKTGASDGHTTLRRKTYRLEASCLFAAEQLAQDLAITDSERPNLTHRFTVGVPVEVTK